MRLLLLCAGFATLVLVDSLWIYANSRRYMTLTLKMTQEPIFRWPAVISCYMLLGLLIAFFIIPNVEEARAKKESCSAPIYRSALLGAIVYGVYATTNCAVVSSYTIPTAIVETLWGSALMAITTIVLAILVWHDLA